MLFGFILSILIGLIYFVIIGAGIYALLKAIIIAACVALGIWIIRSILSFLLKKSIAVKYSFAVPQNVSVGLNLFYPNSVVWRRSHWRYERIDGGPDRRYNHNVFVEPYSKVFVSHYMLYSKDKNQLKYCIACFRERGIMFK